LRSVRVAAVPPKRRSRVGESLARLPGFYLGLRPPLARRSLGEGGTPYPALAQLASPTENLTATVAHGISFRGQFEPIFVGW